MAIQIIMLITSIVIIVSVCLQEGRSDGLSGAIGGGAEQLFGKKRRKATDIVLHRITFGATLVFFIVSLIAVVL